MTAPVAAAAPAAAPATSTPAPATPANGKPADAPQAPVDSGKPNAKPAETAAEKAYRLRRKIKVGGKEVDVDLGEEELVRELQISRHHQQTRQDFDRKMADFEARQQRLAEDPDGFFEENGIDLEAILESRAQRREAMKQLTPEQQEIQRYKNELEKFKAAEVKRKQTEAQQAEVAEQQARVQGELKLYGEVFRALGQEVGKPGASALMRTLATVREMAEHAGEPPMSAQQLAAAAERFDLQQATGVVERMASNEAWRAKHAPLLQKMATTALRGITGEALLATLGMDITKAVLAASWAKTRSMTAPIVQEPPRPEGAPQTNNGTQKQLSDWDIIDRIAAR